MHGTPYICVKVASYLASLPPRVGVQSPGVPHLFSSQLVVPSSPQSTVGAPPSILKVIGQTQGKHTTNLCRGVIPCLYHTFSSETSQGPKPGAKGQAGAGEKRAVAHRRVKPSCSPKPEVARPAPAIENWHHSPPTLYSLPSFPTLNGAGHIDSCLGGIVRGERRGGENGESGLIYCICLHHGIIPGQPLTHVWAAV